MIIDLLRKIEVKPGTRLIVYDNNETNWNSATVASVDEENSRVIVIDEKGFKIWENAIQLVDPKLYRFD